MERILGWERVWGSLIDASKRFHDAIAAYEVTPWGNGQRKRAWNRVKGLQLQVFKAHRAAIRWCGENNEHIPDWLKSAYDFV